MTTLGASSVKDLITGGITVTFNSSVLPGVFGPQVYFQYGLTAGYGAVTPMLTLPIGTNPIPVNLAASGIGEGYTVYYRAVATNNSGIVYGQGQNVLVPFEHLPGDTDRNGVVSQAELDAVLANYWPNSPWLHMTNVAGLGSTNVSFALTNSLAGAYNVEYSTNLANWELLGPAIPRYEFIDTNAIDGEQRHYRLRWP